MFQVECNKLMFLLQPLTAYMHLLSHFFSIGKCIAGCGKRMYGTVPGCLCMLVREQAGKGELRTDTKKRNGKERCKKRNSRQGCVGDARFEETVRSPQCLRL